MTGQEIIHPATAEIIPLDGPTDQLAEALLNIRNLEADLRSVKQQIGDELHRRMDREGKWTVHLPDMDVTGQAPSRVEYDAEGLAFRLQALVNRGVITEAAQVAAVEPHTSWKVRKQGVNALLKLGGEVAEEIRATERPVEAPRRISISTKRPRG